MISYRKTEIEDLAHAIGRHWGGQTRDWQLVIEPTHLDATPAVALHVEIALGSFTRFTAIPLCKPPDTRISQTNTCATAPRNRCRDDTTVAAVRRASLQALLAQVAGHDIEPLLGYLRGCGILVLD